MEHKKFIYAQYFAIMTQQWLPELAIICMETGLSEQFDYEEIIIFLASRKNRKKCINTLKIKLVISKTIFYVVHKKLIFRNKVFLYFLFVSCPVKRQVCFVT